jgi:hypothetical protein
MILPLCCWRHLLRGKFPPAPCLIHFPPVCAKIAHHDFINKAALSACLFYFCAPLIIFCRSCFFSFPLSLSLSLSFHFQGKNSLDVLNFPFHVVRANERKLFTKTIRALERRKSHVCVIFSCVRRLLSYMKRKSRK